MQGLGVESFGLYALGHGLYALGQGLCHLEVQFDPSIARMQGMGQVLVEQLCMLQVRAFVTYKSNLRSVNCVHAGLGVVLAEQLCML